MQTWVSGFFSLLHHEHLKPLDFRKSRYIFSKNRGAYIERFNFQGSAWNAAGETWNFYINVGVEFKDLPADSEKQAPWMQSHWMRRIEDVVKGAPQQFSIRPDAENRDEMLQLVDLVAQASQVLESGIDRVRNSYSAKRYEW